MFYRTRFPSHFNVHLEDVWEKMHKSLYTCLWCFFFLFLRRTDAHRGGGNPWLHADRSINRYTISQTFQTIPEQELSQFSSCGYPLQVFYLFVCLFGVRTAPSADLKSSPASDDTMQPISFRPGSVDLVDAHWGEWIKWPRCVWSEPANSNKLKSLTSIFPDIIL